MIARARMSNLEGFGGVHEPSVIVQASHLGSEGGYFLELVSASLRDSAFLSSYHLFKATTLDHGTYNGNGDAFALNEQRNRWKEHVRNGHAQHLLNRHGTDPLLHRMENQHSSRLLRNPGLPLRSHLLHALSRRMAAPARSLLDPRGPGGDTEEEKCT